MVLADHRKQMRPDARRRIVGGALMGVLAVGEIDDLLVGAHVQRRELVGFALGEPACDRRVVAGG